MTVKRAKSQLELNCLQRINLASIEPKTWTAAAWLLQHVVQNPKYRQSAKEINRSSLNFSVAEIARELDMDQKNRLNGHLAIDSSGERDEDA